MQNKERCYLAAVSLNNSAVRLIERGRYPQALSVLQDSIVAIRDAAFDPFHCACYDNPDDVTISMRSSWFRVGSGRTDGVLDLEGALNRANRFVMDSAALPVFAACTGPRVQVEPQTLDVDVPNLPKTMGGVYPVSTIPLLRIDAALCNIVAADGANSADSVAVPWYLASICVLHNLAVAALLHPLTEQGLRKGATDTLRLGFRLAYRLAETKDGGPFVTAAVLQLSAMMAQCDYQLRVEVGDCQQAWEALARYRAIRSALAQELRTARLLEDLTTTHAKAA